MTELLETAREFGMEVQPQLVLLQKTLLYVEGLGRQLYPQLDLWETAEPFMRRWAVKHLVQRRSSASCWTAAQTTRRTAPTTGAA